MESLDKILTMRVIKYTLLTNQDIMVEKISTETINTQTTKTLKLIKAKRIIIY